MPTKQTRAARYAEKEQDLIRAIEDFHEKYPTEANCIEDFVESLKIMDLFRCYFCYQRDLYQTKNPRVFQCNDCNKTTWITSGTIFDGVRRLRAWFAGTYLLERGVSISSLRFSKEFGIAQSSALMMLNTLRMLVASRIGNDGECLPEGFFYAAINKRSRLTPAGEHPIASAPPPEHDGSSGFHKERTASSEATTAPDFDTQSESAQTSSFSDPFESELQGSALKVYELLSDKPIDFDLLLDLSGLEVGELSATLFLLELGELAKALTGNYYVRSAPKKRDKSRKGSGDNDSSTEVVIPSNPAMVHLFIQFLLDTFHGISKKYLQLYLAEFWCFLDRSIWGPGSLLRACLSNAPIRYQQILAFASPPVVLMKL